MTEVSCDSCVLEAIFKFSDRPELTIILSKPGKCFQLFGHSNSKNKVLERHFKYKYYQSIYNHSLIFFYIKNHNKCIYLHLLFNLMHNL